MLLKLSSLSRRLIKSNKIPKSMLNHVLEAVTKSSSKSGNSLYHVVQPLTDKQGHDPYVYVASECDEAKLVQNASHIRAREGPYIVHQHLAKDTFIKDPSIIVSEPVVETAKIKQSETRNDPSYKINQKLANVSEVDNPFAPVDLDHQHHHEQSQKLPYAVHQELASKFTNSSKIFFMDWFNWKPKNP